MSPCELVSWTACSTCLLYTVWEQLVECSSSRQDGKEACPKCISEWGPEAHSNALIYRAPVAKRAALALRASNLGARPRRERKGEGEREREGERGRERASEGEGDCRIENYNSASCAARAYNCSSATFCARERGVASAHALCCIQGREDPGQGGRLQAKKVSQNWKLKISLTYTAFGF